MFWYHEELDRLDLVKEEVNHHPKLVFYGSSSFNYWKEIAEDFKEYDPINLGFGGSTLAACSWFFERAFDEICPEAIIIYAGDNDLGQGRHPEEVVLYFQTLVQKIREAYGDIPVAFVSIKPSISRWHLRHSIDYANVNIEKLSLKDPNIHYINIFDAMLNEQGVPDSKYFVEDGLHLTREGYLLWLKIIKEKTAFFLDWQRPAVCDI